MNFRKLASVIKSNGLHFIKASKGIRANRFHLRTNVDGNDSLRQFSPRRRSIVRIVVHLTVSIND